MLFLLSFAAWPGHDKRTMPQKQLQEALAALHDELESEKALSAEERAALVETLEEIKGALSRGGELEPQAAAEGALSGRVSALIGDFEASHPRFAEMLRTVSESLANIGI